MSMKLTLTLIGAALAALPALRASLAPADAKSWLVLGLELPCQDVKRAAAFYEATLGYARIQESESSATLRLGEVLLVLTLSETPTSQDALSQVYLNHHVLDLNESAAKIVKLGGTRLFEEPLAFVLGHSLACLDTEGNTVNLVRLSRPSEPELTAPEIFNLSITSPLRDEIGDFFLERLGFEVYSSDYLPKTLPLKQKGSAMLVLHIPEKGVAAREPKGRTASLLLAWPSEEAAKKLGTARPGSAQDETSYLLRGPKGLEFLAVSGVAPKFTSSK